MNNWKEFFVVTGPMNGALYNVKDKRTGAILYRTNDSNLAFNFAKSRYKQMLNQIDKILLT